jgi:hypothetical protein
VHAFAKGAGGAVCFGGAFTEVNAVARGRLACVSAVDGGLVVLWNPNADDTVFALQAIGGAFYAGGAFNGVGGQLRARAARLELGDDGDADGWNPAPSSTVFAIAPGTAGTIYLGGGFDSAGGAVRRGVAKVDTATGNALATWNAGGADGIVVRALLTAGAGGVYVAGSFDALGSSPRLRLARLDAANGGAVPGFDPAVGIGEPSVLADDGAALLAAGTLAEVGGIEHLGLVRVTAGGTVDAAFVPRFEGPARRRRWRAIPPMAASWSAACSCAPTPSRAGTC